MGTIDGVAEGEAERTVEQERSLEYMDELDKAAMAVEQAYATGKAERAKITQSAQLDAAEAVAMAGVAMESDEAADEAMRIRIIAEKSGNREKAREARQRERAARKKANEDHRAATASAKSAYKSIKFSAPNKLGFMRVLQVLFVIHIVFEVIYLILTSRDLMVYSTTNVMDWVMVVLDAVAFWMFVNRYKIARPFVIGMAAFGLVVPIIADALAGTLTFVTFIVSLINGIYYIVLILYFSLSRRVRMALVNDFATGGGDFDKDDFAIDRKGWPYIRNLIIYFVVFSILGHWMELGMCMFIVWGLVQGGVDYSNTMLWRDWLFPFAMEGIAVVLIALILYPLFEQLKKRIRNRVVPYILSFAANALFCSVIELIGGLLFNAQHQLWDYSDHLINFMGQVCLQNTLAFGVAASLITWFVYPMLERWIARVPRDVMNIVFIAVLMFGITVYALYAVNLPVMPDLVPAG